MADEDECKHEMMFVNIELRAFHTSLAHHSEQWEASAAWSGDEQVDYSQVVEATFQCEVCNQTWHGKAINEVAQGDTVMYIPDFTKPLEA